MLKISIIIPVLNEKEWLLARLDSLQPWRERGHEIIVVDGGSDDGSQTVPAKLVDRWLQAAAGRAVQMNTGAAASNRDVLLFLHVDTELPDQADQLIDQALALPERCWGRFDVRLNSDRPIFSIIAKAMNLRSHLTGVVTGDQGLFVRRELFNRLSGFAEIPLMEDIEISKRLRAHAWPVRIRDPATTSARRWERQGIWKTVRLMWWLRLRYFLGGDPRELYRIYYKKEV